MKKGKNYWYMLNHMNFKIIRLSLRRYAEMVLFYDFFYSESKKNSNALDKEKVYYSKNGGDMERDYEAMRCL